MQISPYDKYQEIYNSFSEKFKDLDGLLQIDNSEELFDKIQNNSNILNKYSGNLIVAKYKKKKLVSPVFIERVIDSLAESGNFILISDESGAGKTSAIVKLCDKEQIKEKFHIFFFDINDLSLENLSVILFSLLIKIHDSESNVLIICDNLQTNFVLSQKIIHFLKPLLENNPSSKIKFIGMVWKEFQNDILEFIGDDRTRIFSVSKEVAKTMLVNRNISEKDFPDILEYTKNNLLLLHYTIDAIKDDKKTIKDFKKYVPKYIYHKLKRDFEIDESRLKDVLLLSSTIGLFDLKFEKKFLDSFMHQVPTLTDTIIEKILRQSDGMLTLGHKRYCEILYDYLSDENQNSISDSSLKPEDILFEYITTYPEKRWTVFKYISEYVENNQNDYSETQTLLDILNNLVKLITKIEVLNQNDPTWGGDIPSIFFAQKSLREIAGIDDKRCDSFIEKIYEIDESQSHLKIKNIEKLPTNFSFEKIKNHLNHDGDKSLRRLGETINFEKFHTNWLTGFILGIEKYLSSERLNQLVNKIEENGMDDSTYYPREIPWCTARNLIGLGICNKTTENSKTVKKITDRLLKHENYEDGKWKSNTGSWNSWMETTALVIKGLNSVKASLDPEIKKQVRKQLYESKETWKKNETMIDKVLPIEAFILVGGSIHEVQDVIKDVLKMMNSEADAIEDFHKSNLEKISDQDYEKQTSDLVQGMAGLSSVVWMYLEDLKSGVLEAFVEKRKEDA